MVENAGNNYNSTLIFTLFVKWLVLLYPLIHQSLCFNSNSCEEWEESKWTHPPKKIWAGWGWASSDVPHHPKDGLRSFIEPRMHIQFRVKQVAAQVQPSRLTSEQESSRWLKSHRSGICLTHTSAHLDSKCYKIISTQGPISGFLSSSHGMLSIDHVTASRCIVLNFVQKWSLASAVNFGCSWLLDLTTSQQCWDPLWSRRIPVGLYVAVLSGRLMPRSDYKNQSRFWDDFSWPIVDDNQTSVPV